MWIDGHWYVPQPHTTPGELAWFVACFAYELYLTAYYHSRALIVTLNTFVSCRDTDDLRRTEKSSVGKIVRLDRSD